MKIYIREFSSHLTFSLAFRPVVNKGEPSGEYIPTTVSTTLVTIMVSCQVKAQVVVFLALFFLKDMAQGGGVGGKAMNKNRIPCDYAHKHDCRPAQSDHGYIQPCKKSVGCKKGHDPPIHPRDDYKDAPSLGRGGDQDDGDGDDNDDDTYKYNASADGTTIVQGAYSIGY